MLKPSIIILLLVALTAARRSSSQRKTANIVWSDDERERRVEELLTGVGTDDVYRHVHKPFPYNDPSMYTDSEALRNFTRYWNEGFLVKYGVYTLNCRRTIRDTDSLFSLLYSTKDFQTFYQVAAWAKREVHPEMYVHAFVRALVHRPDTNDLTLPRLYQVLPTYYLPNSIVHQARNAYMNGVTARRFEVNNTGYEWSWHHSEDMLSPHVVHQLYKRFHDVESRLSYFREDVNRLDYMFKTFTRYGMVTPYMMRNGTLSDRLGEIRYLTLRFILTRYNLERYAVGLPPVEPISFDRPIMTGYHPQITGLNGRQIPGRPDGVILQTQNPQGVEKMEKIIRRFYDIVDTKQVRNVTEGDVLRRIEGVEATNVLGNLMFGAESDYYPSLYFNMLALVDGVVSTNNKYATGSLLNVYTMPRDPAYYQVLAYVDSFFEMLHRHHQPYTRQELGFPGVRIEDVIPTVLETRFEYHNFNISNMIPGRGGKDYSASQFRINHKDFIFTFNVTSDRDTSGIIKMFLGPAVDHKKDQLDLNDFRKSLMPFYSFPVKLYKGTNMFRRTSPPSYQDRHVKDRINYVGRSECFYPDNLLLPKGTERGTFYKFYIVIYPYKDVDGEYDSKHTCTEKFAAKDYDHTFMFPVDRHWERWSIAQRNHKIITSKIFHTDIPRPY